MMKKNILIAGVAAFALAGGAAIAAQNADGYGPMRGMMTKSMTRADVDAMVKERFSEIDTNKDGAITMDEVRAHHDAARSEHLDRMFKMMDANGDGSVSKDEFMATHQGMGDHMAMGGPDGPPPAGAAGAPPPSGAGGRMGMRHGRHHDGSGMGMQMGERMFERADANKDGKVTLQEAETAALAHFDKVDANHDGTVTPQERMDYWKAKKAD